MSLTGSPERPSRIGPYPIEREVGRGGMGIVYLGRDAKLDRPVAIKVLPEAFASDPDRLARFEREARLLASLNHPNIAGIYGLEEADGRRFLALEFVEGETLAQRIAHGPLAVDEAVDVCRQIAAALEAAHENGVIHRDLKPGNVKLTPAGEVKVLDFGLAKGGTATSSVSDPSMSQSPTVALTATGAGVILGTAAYMSPEQARGKVVDRRTDIWSFGCVLYECLTGKQAFAGETISDMIALILQGEPDWDALPADVPPRVRELLDRCLAKDAKKRLRDIGEARLALEGGLDASSAAGRTLAPVTAAAKPTGRSLALPVAIAGGLAIAVASASLTWMLFARGGGAGHPVRLLLSAPSGWGLAAESAFTALSPDGTMLAMVCFDSTGTSALWLRPLDAVEARRLPGTEDAEVPLWSPDSRYIAFSTQEKLKKIEVRGGNPEVLCSIGSYGRGGSWGPAGTIVFAPAGEGPLSKISANGGTPEPLTVLDSTETGHRFPRFLPDGRHFMFASLPPREGGFEIYVGSIDSPKRERLLTADGTPVYVEPGYLLYTRNGRLVAHRFDASRRRLRGEPVTLLDEPSASDWLGNGRVVASRDGPIGYFRRRVTNTEMVWLDPSGRRLERVPVPEGNYEVIVPSPDRTLGAVVKRTSATESDLWLVDFARGSMTRLTFGPGRVEAPVWSRDGSQIAFSSNRGGSWDLYEKPLSGAAPEVRIATSGSLLNFPRSWSPDGRYLMYEQLDAKTGWDLWIVPMDGERTPSRYSATPFDERNADISPDGQWVSYSSNESGRNEVFVQSFPTPGRKHQVSTAGGDYSIWRADGRQIAFGLPNGAGSMVDVRLDGGFSTGAVTPLHLGSGFVWVSLTRDFKRAIALVQIGDANPSNDLTMVLNWRAELKRR